MRLLTRKHLEQEFRLMPSGPHEAQHFKTAAQLGKLHTTSMQSQQITGHHQNKPPSTQIGTPQQSTHRLSPATPPCAGSR